MPALSETFSLSGYQKQSGTFAIRLLILLIICIFDLPAEAQTSIYVFVPGQSTVVQTGGIAGVNETYGIEGKFRLTVDFDATIASFDKVDANLIETTGFLYSQSLGGIFNMTALAGTIVDDTTIQFEGKTGDGTESYISLSLTLEDDLALLSGKTTPPPNNADMFLYELDAVATKKYAGGAGEPDNPYHIATAEDLMLLGETLEDYDKHFILTADIDLDPNLPGLKVFDKAVIAPDTVPNDKYSMLQGTPFTGVFDGNNHIISHLTIEGDSLLGLFGQLDNGATISNLGLEAVDVEGTDYCVGGLVGSVNGSITNCHSSTTVSGMENVGGLVGSNGYSGKISNCYSTGSVSGDRTVGGLVATNSFGHITNCYATAGVDGKVNVGGLTGLNGYAGTISNCYSKGSISGNRYVGGLVGVNLYGHVMNCYARATVAGNMYVAGFVGLNYEGSIWLSYSTGSVTGTEKVGGLVGENTLIPGQEGLNNTGIIGSSFWDLETSGQLSSDGGTGLTTAEMQMASTFLEAGWDFVDETENGTEDIWWILEGRDYPRFVWELNEDE